MASIGVALSGGGHRAALFGLGVLLYLVDARKNQEVTSVASVSGGSLTNGYVAQAIDYSTADAAQFEPVACRVARQISTRGTLWAAPLTWLYLLLLVATAAAAIVGVWFLPLNLGLRVLLFFAGLVVFGWIASWRGVVCARAFASTLFSAAGQPTPLRSVHSAVDHVLCATDLHWGEHVYFSGRFVCAYRFGWGAPGDLLLADAVHASAAYPGGFPARSFPTDRHAFAKPGDERAREVRALKLVDGGAYDNMADEWGLRVQDRNARWATLNPALNVPEELVVVNCSAPLDLNSLSKLRLPVLGEALTLKRDIDILYDTTTSTRRRWLVDIFRSGGPLAGAIVQISQSPFRIPTSYAEGDDEQAGRARAILDLLGDTPEARETWDAHVRRTRGVKTTLSRIRSEDGADLVQHGYVLALANLHVLLAYPRLELPPRERFSALFRSTAEGG